MRYDPIARTLSFSSQEELEGFHRELSTLMRSAMVGATRHISDPERAKAASSKLFKELSTVMRTLNVVRRKLPRKSF